MCVGIPAKVLSINDSPALPKVGLASRRCGDRGRLRGGGGSGRFAPCPPGAVRRSDGVWCGVYFRPSRMVWDSFWSSLVILAMARPAWTMT